MSVRTGRRSRRRTAPPVLARIAGLPTEVLERLSTDLCDALPERDRLAAALEAARAELEARLFAAVPGAPPELRRVLLAVKRDCHNARPLAAHASSPAWDEVRARAGEAADRVAALEAEAAALDAAFEARFARERDRQRRLLRGLLRDRAFARGLALATPDLARALRQAGAAADAPGRRDERADTALLRYASRAAIKVSPFSTFTPVGLGSVRRDAGPAGVELRGPWRARSLVRLKRFLLDQSVFLLLRYPPFADRLPVALNDSACETEPGRYVFLRPGRWAVDAERGELRYHPEALVRMAPQGPVDTRVSELLARRRLTRAALLATLEAELAGRVDAAGVRERVEYLLEVGFIEPVLPWPGQEPWLERRILAHLRTLPPDPALAAYVAELQAVVALQDGYAAAADPGAALAELERRIQALREAAARLGGVDPALAARGGPAEYHVYEDVLLETDDGGCSRDVLRLSRASAERALESVRPLVRLSALYDRSHDFLETLDAFARGRWPGAGSVGAMELFHAAQPLWREYARFYAKWWKEKDVEATWNPLELPELAALARLRGEVQAALPGCLEPRGGENHVDPAAIEALLDPLPARWTDAGAWGACLLLQPASADGSRWMLSRVKEGTGRYGSRYTAAMAPDARRRYTAHLAERGAFMLGGERVELLDVPRAQGDTLNVHAPQTPRVLTFPGDAPAVEPGRRVSLGALRVRFGGGRATLHGPGGERFLPVHLGMAFECYMPQAVRFLCAFGPNELGGVFPRQPVRREGEVTVADRTVLGNLVLHRRGWVVPTAPLAEAARGGDARAFAAVDRLRAGWGLPPRAFFSERLSNFFFGTVHKPQYLDFTSPLFLPLLRDALEGAGESLHLAEMLPDFGMCPRDGAGRRWAVEVMVDSLALRAPLPRGSSATAGARAGHPAAVAGG